MKADTPSMGYGRAGNTGAPSDPMPRSKAKLRCVIVEDHIMIEQLMRGMLDSLGALEVVGVAHNVKEGLAACRAHQPDLLLLDLALPDGDGIDVAHGLAKLRPDARAIVVTGQAETFICPRELRSFIYSVIDKTSAFSLLQQEVERLRAGMFPAVTAGAQAAPEEILSSREMQVFRLIGEGLMSKEIADRLGLAKTTVDTYRKNMAAKLGTNGSELARRAWLHGRIPADRPRP